MFIGSAQKIWARNNVGVPFHQLFLWIRTSYAKYVHLPFFPSPPTISCFSHLYLSIHHLEPFVAFVSLQCFPCCLFHHLELVWEQHLWAVWAPFLPILGLIELFPLSQSGLHPFLQLYPDVESPLQDFQSASDRVLFHGIRRSYLNVDNKRYLRILSWKRHIQAFFFRIEIIIRFRPLLNQLVFYLYCLSHWKPRLI